MSAGIWVHSYSVTPPRRGQIFGNSGWLSSESDVMAHDHHVMVEAVKQHLVAFWYILVRHIYSVMSPFNDVSVHIMSAPLHCYTNKPGSEFGNSGVTVKLKWCHNVMVEAEDHLWLLLTSILDIYIVLWHLLMMSVCILWMRPYSVTPPRRGQILAILGSLPSGNDAMTHGWGCKPHLIASHIHIGNI